MVLKVYSEIVSDVTIVLSDGVSSGVSYILLACEFLFNLPRIVLTKSSSVGYFDFLMLSGNRSYKASKYTRESYILNIVSMVLLSTVIDESFTRLRLK